MTPNNSHNADEQRLSKAYFVISRIMNVEIPNGQLAKKINKFVTYNNIQ